MTPNQILFHLANNKQVSFPVPRGLGFMAANQGRGSEEYPYLVIIQPPLRRSSVTPFREDDFLRVLKGLDQESLNYCQVVEIEMRPPSLIEKIYIYCASIFNYLRNKIKS